MKHMHIVICDDIPEHLEHIRQLIEDRAQAAGWEVVLDAFSDAEALLSALSERNAAEIAVLDIAMEGMDGHSPCEEAERYVSALPNRLFDVV